MYTGKSKNRSPSTFFAMIFAFTVPFWVLSTRINVKGLPDNLPVMDVGATFVPLIVALVLVYREDKIEGVKRLLRKTFDYEKIKQKSWYLPIIFLMPFLYVLTYWVMRLSGLPVPTVWSAPVLTPIILIAFFIAAAGEELGYMGYLIDPMQDRWSALTTCLIVGPIWAIWHFPSMFLLGQSPTLMA